MKEELIRIENENIIADPCNLIQVISQSLWSDWLQHYYAAGDVVGSIFTWRGVSFTVLYRGDDGFHFGVPVDSGTVISCSRTAWLLLEAELKGV